MNEEIIQKELKKYASKQKAAILSRFFKTGKGEYGEGDIFMGVKVPEQRQVAKKYYKQMPLTEIKKLINHPVHECRLTGLIMLVTQFEKGDEQKKEEIYKFYLQNLQGINNWDLVDLTAPKIVGAYLLDKQNKRKLLYKMVKSNNIWERRIAVLATYSFIKNNDYKDIFTLSENLLNDEHDLMHKAVGWMLREVGNRDQKAEEEFLKKHHKKMPRTMLRYAIEKFDQNKRMFYMKK